MMNSSKYPMNSYVPTKPTVKFHDLHTRLQEMTFNKVVNNPEQHFDNVYITNFDLIHKYRIRTYETKYLFIFYEKKTLFLEKKANVIF